VSPFPSYRPRQQCLGCPFVHVCGPWTVAFLPCRLNNNANNNNNDTATKPEQDRQILQIGQQCSTHIFYLFAIETAGTWHEMAIELPQEIGRHITTITEDNIPFPVPFCGSPKRKCGFFSQHHGHRVNCHCNHNFVCLA